MENNVIKRDGSVVSLDVGKIKSVISWSCKGLDVNPLELECKVDDFLKDNIPTTSIHDNIIYHAQAIATADKSDWVYVAGRLNTMKRWKDTEAYEKDFPLYLSEMEDLGLYTHPSLKSYSVEELIDLGDFIDPTKDLAHSYGSTLTAEKKYLLPGETIQNMFMVEAMIIFSSQDKSVRLQKVKDLYTALSDRKISLATPWLANLRSNGNISSCFIISLGDNIESITDNWAKAAKISKVGGGLGVYLGNLRAKGASVAGRKNAAKSVTAPVKVFNDIAVYIDQGGKRSGAITVALPVWHDCIEEFLEIQSETGDIRNKAYDIFPQVVTPDLFWEINEQEGDWYTFCPAESKKLGFNLNGCYGEEFKSNYLNMVALAEKGKLEVYSKHSARELVKKVMRTQFETGLPYITYVDALNRNNPNKHEGFIPCFNLCTESTSNVVEDKLSHTCLTKDSLVLTSKGVLPITLCDGEDVITPYVDDKGDSFSEITTQKAKLLPQGVKPVYKVRLSTGQSVKGTKDHKLLTDNGYQEIKDLSVGSKIRIPRELKNLEVNSPKVSDPEARALGWIMGDGWTREGNIGVCFAKHEALAQEDVLRTLKTLHESLDAKKGGRVKVPEVHVQPNGVVNWQTKKSSFSDYFYNKYNLKPSLGKNKRLSETILTATPGFKREFLASLFSADGCVVQPTNVKNKPYVAYTSASEGLLQDIQNILVQFGILANYSYSKVKNRNTSQGTLSIKGVNNLTNFKKFIGFNLSPEKQSKLEGIDTNSNLVNKNNTYAKVIELEYLGEEEVYDLALPEKHHFVVNGIVSHNCNLASVVVGRCENYEELSEMAGLLTEVLDSGIELTSNPTECSGEHNNRYRTIGVGVQGMHDWLAKNYTNYYNIEDGTKVAEYIQYGCVKKSIALSKEKGCYPAYNNSDWDNGVMFDKFKKHSVAGLDWDVLKEECKRYGIRNSQMTSPAPNTSTSVFMDAGAGVMPVYSAFFREDNDNGKYPISCMHLKLNPLSYSQSFKTYNQARLTEFIGGMQKFVDTGISAEYLLDQNKEDFTAKNLYDILTQSYKNGCKAVYYIRSIKKGESVEDLLGIKEEGCAGCAG